MIGVAAVVHMRSISTNGESKLRPTDPFEIPVKIDVHKSLEEWTDGEVTTVTLSMII